MKMTLLSPIRWALLIGCSAFLVPIELDAEVRTWTNKNGEKTEAEYISHTDQEVMIRRTTDNQVFKFPVTILSDADKEWLEQQGDASAGETGEGIYIAVGNGAHRMSSLDGVTWTNHEFIDKPGHDQNDIMDIAVGNGACVAIGGFSRSNIFTTTDGVGWEKSDFNIEALSGVIFHDGRFIAFGIGGRIAASADGYEWKQIGDARLRERLKQEAEKLGEEKGIKSIIRSWAESNGTFVGSGDNGFLIVTKDFENWEFPPRIEPRSRLFIASDANGFVVKGSQALHHSPDGLTWTDVTPDIGDQKFNSIVHDGEKFLANTNKDEGWVSKDGIAWEKVDGTFPGHLAALRPDLYYAFQNYWKFTEDLKRSTDGGKTWESCELPAPVGITHITFAEGLPAFPEPGTASDQ